MEEKEYYQWVMEKAKIRRLMAEKRHSLSKQERERAAESLAKSFMESVEYENKAIAIYYPKDDEINLLPLAQKLAAENIRLSLPRMEGESLVFKTWRPGEELAQGKFGVMEPPHEAKDILPDIVITPMLAFDRKKNRLGYGGGYYDRTIAALRAKGKPLIIGAAYSIQEVMEIPTHEYDQKLDMIITEKEIII